MPPPLVPTPDDIDDLFLSCRYGDLPDVQSFLARFPPTAVDDARDDHGNTVLHMAAANGHTDLLAYLLPLLSPALLLHQNTAGSTALHWVAVNRHLAAAQALVGFSAGPGADLIDVKNGAGRTPLGEAEMAGWDEGARWLVQVMKLDDEKATAKEGEEEVGEVDPRAVEVEIQDADGQVGRMTINPHSNPEPSQGRCSDPGTPYNRQQ